MFLLLAAHNISPRVKIERLIDSNLILWPGSKVFTRLPVKRGILAGRGKQCIHGYEKTARLSGFSRGQLLSF